MSKLESIFVFVGFSAGFKMRGISVGWCIFFCGIRGRW